MEMEWISMSIDVHLDRARRWTHTIASNRSPGVAWPYDVSIFRWPSTSRRTCPCTCTYTRCITMSYTARFSSISVTFVNFFSPFRRHSLSLSRVSPSPFSLLSLYICHTYTEAHTCNERRRTRTRHPVDGCRSIQFWHETHWTLVDTALLLSALCFSLFYCILCIIQTGGRRFASSSFIGIDLTCLARKLREFWGRRFSQIESDENGGTAWEFIRDSKVWSAVSICWTILKETQVFSVLNVSRDNRYPL